jgi:hypothetical protein
MLVSANFPGGVWDGSTKNPDRTDRNRIVDPDALDWDRISSEVIAIQEWLLDPANPLKGVKGVKGDQGDPGASNNLPDPSALVNGIYNLTMLDGVPSWTVAGA